MVKPQAQMVRSEVNLPALLQLPLWPPQVLFKALDQTTLSVSVPSQFPAAKISGAPRYSGLYSAYWPGGDPSQTGIEVQPIIVDPLTNLTFAPILMNPYTVPPVNTYDRAYLPPSMNSTLADPSAEILSVGYDGSLLSTPISKAVALDATNQAIAFLNNTQIDAASECQTCQQALQMVQALARQVPWEVAPRLINLCNMYKFPTSPSSTC